MKEELEATGCTITDEDTLMTIIQGIKPEFETFVQCLTVNKTTTELNLENTITSLIREEKRRNESTNQSDFKEDQMFFSKEDKLKCYSCNKTGHVSKNCRMNKHRDKTCLKCNKIGHIVSECRS